MKKRVGIFGGTFAPIHNAHIRIALEFKERFHLDTLIIVPSSIPVHKPQPKGDTVNHRFQMLKLAFESEGNEDNSIVISDYEIEKQGKNYTVDTLKHFYSEDSELYLLCGTDMLLSFHTWKSTDEIAKLATLVFARRESTSDKTDNDIENQKLLLKEKFGLNIMELKIPAWEISSTFIRENIDKDLSELLPEKVLKYINDNNLYRG